MSESPKEIQPKTPRRRRRKHDWPAIIKDWQSSKLTAKAYCDKYRLATSAFYLWKKKQTVSKKPFVPVQIESPIKSNLLSNHFDPKPQIDIPNDISQSQLKMVMQLLAVSNVN